MNKLNKYMKPYTSSIFIVIVLTFAQSIGQLYLPTLMGDIVNKGIVEQNMSFVIKTGLIMLAFTLVVTICTIGTRYFASKTAIGMSKDLRRDIFVKVSNYSLHEFDQIGTASLITRTTNDVTQIQNVYVMILSMLLAAPITAVGGIIMALRKDVPLSSIIVVVVAVMAIAIGLVATKAMKLFKSLQKKIDNVNRVLRETLTGIRVIRAFNRKEYENKRFEGVNRELTDNSIKVFKLMGMLLPLIILIMNITMISIIWFGGIRIDAGAMQVGDLMAYQQYVMQIMFSLIMATMLFVMLPRAAASAERINEILEMKNEIVDTDKTISANNEKGHVVFKDVSFSYDNAEEPALEDVTFEAKPGEVTAIIGGTGSGKSTLINLIPRFYDIQKGNILIDGVDIKDIAQEELRRKIGFVPQKVNLFSGTIEKNIRYGKEDATDEEISEALETAQATEFVSTLPEGIASMVSQGGTNYSGGQKQRLSIARALVRKPEIYVFDDSFSALDFKTDAKLRQALKKDIKNATVFIVAQRVSTVMNAERIIVLDEGRVVGQGTHSELIKQCEVYKEIVASQLSEEELAQ